MKFIVLTLFPEMFTSPMAHSIIKRAKEKNKVTIEYINIRDFATDTHKTVDDHPYGGGVGMVMKVDIVDKALSSIKKKESNQNIKTVLLDPRGTPYTQSIARSFATYPLVVLICGHYEGFDERIRQLVDETISIGDYVVTGGELPAMMIMDSVIRLLPGVLTQDEATIIESFTTPMLEFPQYTRPVEYKGMKVPDILLSGNHAEIEKWRTEEAQKITKEHRPDLLDNE